MKKLNLLLIIGILSILLFSTFASASVLVSYYKLDETTGTNFVDSHGTNDGTGNDARISGGTGIINAGADFTQGNDNIEFDRLLGNQVAGSMSFWLKRVSGTGVSDIVTQSASGSGRLFFQFRENNELRLFVGGNSIKTGDDILSDDVYYHIVFTRDTSGTGTIYVNSVSEASGTLNTNNWDNADTIIGYVAAGGNIMIDEVAVYDRALSSDEIETLYDIQKDGFESGQYDFSGAFNFTITAKDSFDNSTINTFNATINGTLYQTTEGIIITDINVTGIYDITVEAENYVTEEYLNYNTSTNLIAYLESLTLEDFEWITENNTLTLENNFTLNWTEAVSPLNRTVTYFINIYNYTGNIFQSFNTTDLFYDLDLISYNAGDYNITVQAVEDITNVNYTKQITFKVDKLNYVYFRDGTNSSALVNKTVSFKYPHNTTLSLITDNEGKINFSSFVSKVFQIGKYEITYLDVGGFETPITFELVRDETNMPFNVSYNISRTTININIFKRIDGSKLEELTEIIFQGVGNFSTSTGNYTFQQINLASGEYTILVKSNEFYTEQKVFTYFNQESSNLSFYLLETAGNSSVTVTVRVLDTTQTKIDDALVTMLEYDISSLSYKSVSQGYTNSEGEVIFLAELNDKIYKFTASKIIDGTLRTSDSGDGGIIFRDEIVGGSPITFEKKLITLILTGLDEFVFDASLYLRYNITENFNSSTNISNIRVDFHTTDGSETTMCIEYFNIVGVTKTSELQICESGNAGTLTPTTPFLLNRSKTYRLEVYNINNNGIKVVLDSFTYQSSDSFQEILRSYAILKPFILFLWIGIIALGLFSGNIILTGILGICLSVIELVLFPNVLTISGSILKILISLQLIYFGRKKEDFT